MTELFLIAHVAGRGVAIEARLVDSVVDIGEVIAVPRAPALVRGLAALRSRVVTVIDTHVALGLAPAESMGRAVIARIDGHHYAFLVDSLEDVAPYPRQPLSGGQGDGTDVIERNGEPLVIIDPATLVPGALAAAA